VVNGGSMNVTLLVILLGAFVVALAWFLLKFGKVLARWALILGVLAAVIILGLALLENARATRRAVTAATVASAGAAGVSGLALILGGMLLAAVGVIGYLALRLRAAEGWTLLPRRKRRRERLPETEPVVYVVEEEDSVDIGDLNLAEWGW